MSRPKVITKEVNRRDKNENNPVWNRHTGEGPEAYRAFCVYRDSDVSERSYERVAQKLGCAIQLVKRWGSLHKWVSRALAWDDYIDSLQQERSIESRLSMHSRHARAAMSLIEKGTQRLEKMPAGKLSARDRVAMIRTGAEIERLARGEKSNGAGPIVEVNQTQVSLSWGDRVPRWATAERTSVCSAWDKASDANESIAAEESKPLDQG